MKTIPCVLLVTTFMMGCGLASAQPQAYSDYTTLEKCHIINDEHATTSQCPSFANYQIVRTDYDFSQLAVTYGEHQISATGCDFGKKAEWRYHMVGNKKQYHGLIFRKLDACGTNNASELVVVRLDKQNSCILDVLPADKDVNTKARQLADDLNAKCSLEYKYQWD